MNKKTKSGVLESDRPQIQKKLKDFVLEQAKALGYPEEAIVQEIRYWQQSNPDWRTNPTKAQKKSSYKVHNSICWYCKKSISSFEETTFHHLQRGIPEQHEPQNMVPLHKDESFGCHEKAHNATKSFTAGSQRSKKYILKKK